MTTKYKKGKSPGPVDSWLDELGYYRKNVAYDETCLFRAVSEQMFYTQIYHEKIRKECIEYGKHNFQEFSNLVKNKKEWNKHLHTLEIHMVECGIIELELISRRYKHDIIVFDGSKFEMDCVTSNNFSECLLLCVITKDHYDAVYKRDHIAAAGFCQSIVYSILYERVLEVPHVQSIVHSMLYEKSASLLENDTNQDHKQKDRKPVLNLKLPLLCNMKEDNSNDSAYGMAPFPYKVAKALDPNIYRNIEYDTWTDIRRELRMGEWYYGDDNLILGTTCKLNTENGPVECCIQEFVRNKKECVVFIMSSAERKTVGYDELSPADNAKPWPLPYRFSRNLSLIIPNSNNQNVVKNDDKSNVRKRSKKHNNNCSESSSHSNTMDENSAEHITAYEGCPLQMQTASTEVSKTECSGDILLDSPASQQFCWESQWPQIVPSTPEPVAWSPNDVNNNKSLSAQSEVVVCPDYNTPQPVPPYIYNYPSNINYNIWPHAEYIMTPEPHLMPCGTKEGTSENMNSPCRFVFYSDASTYSNGSSQNIMNTPMIPTSPQVGIFTPVYPLPVPPGTPIIYGPPEMGEVVLPPPPAPLSLFSPMMDMQYLPPSPYVYPGTTRQQPWYPPGVNSQGFIFPPPVNSFK